MNELSEQKSNEIMKILGAESLTVKSWKAFLLPADLSGNKLPEYRTRITEYKSMIS